MCPSRITIPRAIPIQHARNMAGMIKRAAEDKPNAPWGTHERASREHVMWMMDRVMFEMDDVSKMNRWIGWAQCCLANASVMTYGEIEQLVMDAYVYPTDFLNYRNARQESKDD